MNTNIYAIQEGSLAHRAHIDPSWIFVSINGKEDPDILDYIEETASDFIRFVFRDDSGNLHAVDIDNDYSSPVGLSFDPVTIDKPKVCKNHCIFCFIDQMKPGMRSSLYVKDDDYRLSFLSGNYVTLTGMGLQDIQRIIKKKFSPVNVSLHATSSSVRCEMMGTGDAGGIMETLRMLAYGGIRMNLQLVLCPGYNDGDVLAATLEDILSIGSSIDSVSTVPVGLTKYRDGLASIEPFQKATAKTVIDTIDEYRMKAEALFSEPLFHASDEFYLTAGIALPPDEYYGDYLQYENGVGMARTFIDTVTEEAGKIKKKILMNDTVLVTGVLGGQILSPLISLWNRDIFPGLSAIICHNSQLGDSITVSGLIFAYDLIRILKRQVCKRALIPSNMLNEDGLFLDSLSIKDVEKETGVRILPVPFDGSTLIQALMEK